MKDPWTGEDRDRGLHGLDGALEAVLERLTEGALAELEVIKDVWPDLVPESLQERSRPVRWENGVLTVEVSDGGAASGLRLQQRRVRTALEEHLARGEVTQIRIRVGRRSNWSKAI
jgi:predicted nucleic acid-binding Zn ribbon protein